MSEKSPKLAAGAGSKTNEGQSFPIDRKRGGDFIGVKRLTYQGRTGYPEKIPTHCYIWYQHFFDLHKVMQDMTKSDPPTKWFKLVKCHYEIDMYQRDKIHKDVYSSDCNHCRSYAEKHLNKSCWWFRVETPHNDKFIRMTFRNLCKDYDTFECSFGYIKILGMFEVEVKLEEVAEGENLRRSYRVQPNSS